jgi:hypothetical protein
LEFGRARDNYYSSDLPDPNLSGNAVAVAWDFFSAPPRSLNADPKIVTGFRGEQHGQRYFFARWEDMDYAMLRNKPLVTFEGRLFENGQIEIHYLEGDFLISGEVYSGVQCWQGYHGVTVPKTNMVAGTKITFTPNYQLDPFSRSIAEDGIPDAWKLLCNINPHCTNAVNMVFNDKGFTLKQCFEDNKNPWTGLPRFPVTP